MSERLTLSIRITQRAVRDLVNVYPVDELDIYERLYRMFDN